ncbi:hypothetical protein DLEV_091 [Diachasmimorpha longicaudata entomopoxvirus]|uniref:Uncharacterized protein n=1 Tax=Diachasmimorpha longicaudata entomopoxvirus TaxID=109981 RepID=A0A7R5WD25_9POXV|nr:hypothetical protein QKK69_gp091 [Diachasmimorpha longicaudata entomopoxvirus]AKS26382.1 hypothetical protein DLEV_091 [Diachasmimorpha longicaudata entomopoxvirus]
MASTATRIFEPIETGDVSKTSKIYSNYFKIIQSKQEPFNYIIVYGTKDDVIQILKEYPHYNIVFSIKTCYALSDIVTKIVKTLKDMKIPVYPANVEIPDNIMLTEDDFAYIELENVDLVDLLRALNYIKDKLQKPSPINFLKKLFKK